MWVILQIWSVNESKRKQRFIGELETASFPNQTTNCKGWETALVSYKAFYYHYMYQEQDLLFKSQPV